jgi:hypothetical protein
MRTTAPRNGQMFTMTGAQFRTLMRVHRKTIKGLADQFDITQKRVRELRAKGASGFRAEELHFMCTGQWPVGTRSV